MKELQTISSWTAGKVEKLSQLLREYHKDKQLLNSLNSDLSTYGYINITLVSQAWGRNISHVNLDVSKEILLKAASLIIEEKEKYLIKEGVNLNDENS